MGKAKWNRSISILCLKRTRLLRYWARIPTQPLLTLLLKERPKESGVSSPEGWIELQMIKCHPTPVDPASASWHNCPAIPIHVLDNHRADNHQSGNQPPPEDRNRLHLSPARAHVWRDGRWSTGLGFSPADGFLGRTRGDRHRKQNIWLGRVCRAVSKVYLTYGIWGEGLELDPLNLEHTNIQQRTSHAWACVQCFLMKKRFAVEVPLHLIWETCQITESI